MTGRRQPDPSSRRVPPGARSLAAFWSAGAAVAQDKNATAAAIQGTQTTFRPTSPSGRRCSATAWPPIPMASRRNSRSTSCAAMSSGSRFARKLGELHAAPRARRHHHAERAVLRAAPWRHRGNRPTDHRLMLHGLVDKPLIFTMEDLKRFPRVNRIHFSNAPPIPAWNGAGRSSTAASSRTAWCTT